MSSTLTTEKFPLIDDMEIHVGRERKGFYYQIIDLTTNQVVDTKDNLTDTMLFDCVACVIPPYTTTDFFKLIHSL